VCENLSGADCNRRTTKTYQAKSAHPVFGWAFFLPRGERVLFVLIIEQIIERKKQRKPAPTYDDSLKKKNAEKQPSSAKKWHLTKRDMIGIV
jgi:hypothetical protein